MSAAGGKSVFLFFWLSLFFCFSGSACFFLRGVLARLFLFPWLTSFRRGVLAHSFLIFFWLDICCVVSGAAFAAVCARACFSIIVLFEDSVQNAPDVAYANHFSCFDVPTILIVF